MRRRNTVAPARRGSSLLGTVARTAVISGTATATSRAVNHSIDQKAMQQQQAMQAQADLEQVKAQVAALQAPPAQTTAASTPPAAQPDFLNQLMQLSELRKAGLLSEEEFQLAKAKLLG